MRDILGHHWKLRENGEPKCVYDNPIVQEIHDRMVEHYLAWEREHVIPQIMAALATVPSDLPPEPHGGRKLIWDSKA